ncbi:MAG TPA: DUF1570 domain-containing protein [Tepidisphaeraceae bacterium]|nr:DUF1570 domain-containing protein [Tepidisphaeraceae bacterium]
MASWRLGGSIILVCVVSFSLSLAADPLRTIETKYYVIHTDLPDLAAREAAVRITMMAEEYHNRTQSFSGRIDQKLPFYLYQNVDDYVAAGGLKGSAGEFNGSALMAVAGEKTTGLTWQIIQHEGFHQFAHSVIRGELPPWLNEGLAEYFGEAIFTGDGYVDGVIPPWRANRVRDRIEKGEFKSMREMMNLPLRDWNRHLAQANYDQAWSMIQFLAHGENNKYQRAMEQFMSDVSKGTPASRAWEKNFGGTIETFESRWKEYWTRLPENPTAKLYAKAVTAILTSYTARAYSQGQTFKTFEDLATAGQNEQIKMSDEAWLPPQLLKEGLQAVEAMKKKGATFELKNASRSNTPQIICTMGDGSKAIGSFSFPRPGQCSDVNVELR